MTTPDTDTITLHTPQPPHFVDQRVHLREQKRQARRVFERVARANPQAVDEFLSQLAYVDVPDEVRGAAAAYLLALGAQAGARRPAEQREQLRENKRQARKDFEYRVRSQPHVLDEFLYQLGQLEVTSADIPVDVLLATRTYLGALRDQAGAR
jgi:hypothetical protein